MTLSTRAFTLAALLSTAAIPALAETPDDQLVVGFSMTNVLTLDPAAITGREPVQILANVYDGLVSLDAKDRAKVNPDLAESWEIAPDGKSITFHLREGATFASGNPVTAEDVVWSLNRLMTLNLAQASFLKTHGFSAENAAASFTAPDAKTVVVTLPKPLDPDVIVQTLGIVGPGSVLDSKLVMENEKDGDMGADWLNSNSAGSGMFGFEGWKANDRVILTRNDDFWGEPSAMKRIIMRHIPELQNQRLMLEKGDIDIGFSLAGPDLKALSEEEGVEVISQPGSGFYYLAVSMKDERFANPKVREALRYLIDYQGINAAIMPYYGQEHQRPIATGFLGELPDPGYTLDVEKAKALLAEAGYPDGFKVSLRALADAPFMSAATAIQATLGQAGHRGGDHLRLRRADLRGDARAELRAAGRPRRRRAAAAPGLEPAGAGLQPGQQRRGEADQLPGLADLVLRSGPERAGGCGAGRDRPREAGDDVPGHPGADRGGGAVDPALLRGARLGRLPGRPRRVRAEPVLGHRPRRHHQGALTSARARRKGAPVTASGDDAMRLSTGGLAAFARQAGTILVTLIGLLVLTFAIGRLMPVDPVRAIVGEEADPATYQQVYEELGMDQPVYVQFARYLGDTLRGDFGTSLRTGQPVAEDIAAVMPATIELATFAILLGAGLGIPLGVWAAVRKNKPTDHIVRVVTLLGHSMPIFWTGMIGLIVFYAWLGWVGGGGRVSDFYDGMVDPVTGFLLIDSALAGDWDVFWDAVNHLILPASILGLASLAYITRMTRSFMLDQLNQEYITTARVKGLSKTRTIWGHAFANIRVQLVTIVALAYGGLLEGAVLIETVFSWPGFGQYMTNNMLTGDMNAVMTCVLLVGVIFITLNLLSDLLYKVFDPRTR